jgi:hypothetical protein
VPTHLIKSGRNWHGVHRGLRGMRVYFAVVLLFSLNSFTLGLVIYKNPTLKKFDALTHQKCA